VLFKVLIDDFKGRISHHVVQIKVWDLFFIVYVLLYQNFNFNEQIVKKAWKVTINCGSCLWASMPKLSGSLLVLLVCGCGWNLIHIVSLFFFMLYTVQLLTCGSFLLWFLFSPNFIALKKMHKLFYLKVHFVDRHNTFHLSYKNQLVDVLDVL
jgi:uncharacterized membrane protein